MQIFFAGLLGSMCLFVWLFLLDHICVSLEIQIDNIEPSEDNDVSLLLYFT